MPLKTVFTSEVSTRLKASALALEVVCGHNHFGNAEDLSVCVQLLVFSIIQYTSIIDIEVLLCCCSCQTCWTTMPRQSPRRRQT